MRDRWNRLTPEQRRAAIDARDAAKVKEQDRRKHAKRRREGDADQKLRIAARDEVRKARLRGDLVPGPCEWAGDDCAGPIHAHHDDYSKPLDVHWLCRYHHDAHHREAPCTSAVANNDRAAPGNPEAARDD